MRIWRAAAAAADDNDDGDDGDDDGRAFQMLLARSSLAGRRDKLAASFAARGELARRWRALRHQTRGRERANESENRINRRLQTLRLLSFFALPRASELACQRAS